jgi:hypothetical protein
LLERIEKTKNIFNDQIKKSSNELDKRLYNIRDTKIIKNNIRQTLQEFFK